MLAENLNRFRCPCGNTARKGGKFCRRCLPDVRKKRRKPPASPPPKPAIDPLRPTYAKRDEVLIEIGFSCYAEYLASQLWRSIREAVYAEKGRQCRICRADATEIHHQNYEKPTLLGKTIGGLYPICHECHENVEFVKGQKCDLNQAIIRFCNAAKIEHKTAKQLAAIAREKSMNALRSRNKRRW